MPVAAPFVSTPNLTAGGNISPARFITLDTSTFQYALQASAATQFLVGVSANQTRYAPGSPADDGYCAIAGESLRYHAAGQIGWLKLGGTVSNPRVLITTDSSGQGVATAPSDGTTVYYGAMALRAGVSGEFIPVWVLSPAPTV